MTDCNMSLRRWQKLMAARTRNAVPIERAGAGLTLIWPDIFVV
jgi:hypothetical protein